MHRREDDHYDPRRRGQREDGDNHTSKKSRSRWDVDDVSKKHEGERSRSSRWDDSSSSSKRSSYQNSKRRWDDKEENSLEISGGRWDKNGRNDSARSGSSQSSSRDRRSRSRSNSPFKRNDQDYSSYSNPSKDDRRLDEPKNSQSSVVNHQSAKNNTSQKHSSWSDSSSDEDGKPRKLDRNLYGMGSSCSEFGQTGQPDLSRDNISATDYMLSKVAPIQTHEFESQDLKSNNATAPGISLKLGSTSAKPMPLPKVISVSVPVKAAKVAAIFNDDDDEPEEMPPECKMRMKNVGRETKTSEGPNSFGKTKIGFCNLSHLAEKKLDGKLDVKKKP
ncbi:unnamed protein product [Orchesella dallaii]|uniref:PEST proteolytic signal-containing nuclear protein n=1 Tax=Orchesella dallaii TaxID=48710 RepID=A0ABP1R0W8_9HEXA